MSKSLRSFPENMRQAIATKRASSSTPGNGRQAARDFLQKKNGGKMSGGNYTTDNKSDSAKGVL